jgi:hypothetical protein
MDHQPWCRFKTFGFEHTDAAKRMADTYNLHLIAGGRNAYGRYFAAALHDGRDDDVLYDTKLDAVRHQHHNEQFYTYIRINPTSSNPCEMEVMLMTARNLDGAGLKLADPDHKHGGMDVIKRSTVEDQRAQSVGRNINLILPEA